MQSAPNTRWYSRDADPFSVAGSLGKLKVRLSRADQIEECTSITQETPAPGSDLLSYRKLRDRLSKVSGAQL